VAPKEQEPKNGASLLALQATKLPAKTLWEKTGILGICFRLRILRVQSSAASSMIYFMVVIGQRLGSL